MISTFTFNAIKILSLAFLSSVISIFIAKFLIDFLYKIKFWKKQPGKKLLTAKKPVFYLTLIKKEKLLFREEELLVWVSMIIVLGFKFLFLILF